MRLRAGQLDRFVTILAKTVITDSDYGTKSVVWSANVSDGAKVVHAEVLDILPSNALRMTDGIIISKRPARVRMRWRTDITQASRLQYEGRQYDIIAGPAEIGRRAGIELMVQELSTEGDHF